MQVVTGNSLATSQKIKNSITILSSNCISGYTPRRTETWVSKAYLYTHLQSSNIHNSQKMEETHVSINRCCCLVAWSCLTLCDPMGCSPSGSSVHGVLQARILEWAAMPSSRGSSQPRDRTQVSCTAGRFSD